MSQMHSMPILLYADVDEHANRTLAGYLTSNRLDVAFHSDINGLIDDLAERSPDALLLGLEFAHGAGLEILRSLRTRFELPILIISDTSNGDIDRVLGLELGAVGHVDRPAAPRETLARIRSLLRRRSAAVGTSPPDSSVLLQFDGWLYDTGRRRLTSPSGADVALTEGELGLLETFVKAPQVPLSRDELMTAMQGDPAASDRSIDVHVSRLRKKLFTLPYGKQLIRTVRRGGYLFEPTVTLGDT